ncbi:MAG: glycoside hydrolase family protein [Planctomycetota bacterium]|jgi:hypothetical protein
MLRSLLLVLLLAGAVHGDDSIWNRRPQPWQRRSDPILSARTTDQSWCRIVCYSPHVIHHDAKFRMWYLGTSTAARANDIVMGYAESTDGIHWKEHPRNPILTAKDVPWGRIIQTPFVLFDDDEQVFKMWFVSGDVPRDANGKLLGNDQRLGYAVSTNGIDWDVHPTPIFPSARSPSVIKDGPKQYRMWMGSRPDVTDHTSGDLYTNIYAFTSEDGIDWKRNSQPVLRPSGPARTVVYPFVMKEGHSLRMWYGCHVAGGKFEIYSATSRDGLDWNVNHDQPVFPAAEDRSRFDARYTSTPCVVRTGHRYLLFYSARDWQNDFVDSQGRKRRDGAGVYSHIGVAELTIE